jgi:hypothetical protein
MEPEHLEAALENLRREVESRQWELRRAQVRASQALRDMKMAQDSVKQMVEVIETVESALRGARRPETLNDFVKAALQSAEGPLRDEEILAAVREEGWRSEAVDPLSVLRTILSRMISLKELVRVSPRTYALPGPRGSWVTEDAGEDEQLELSHAVTGALSAPGGEGGMGEA